MMSDILKGDCLEVMKGLNDNSVDAVVTDPPYGLSFMGKKWDYDVPSQEIWEECLRVLKPGGYLLAFAGTRTQHRMAVRIEDAGFEIRDMIAWVYGSGFPKSLNIGKAVDKLRGDGCKIVGEHINEVTAEWEGWGTALKPAFEPITVARKPLGEKTVALNVLKWGTGGINIDGSRVPANPEVDDMLRTVHRKKRKTKTWEDGSGFKNENNSLTGVPINGRFPANFIHDGSDEVVSLFPNTKSGAMKKPYKYQNNGFSLGAPSGYTKQIHEASEGKASRFFYCAKASKSERNKGCEDLEATRHADRNVEDGVGGANPRNRTNTPKQNFHPTVKPIALMEYLVKLISKENATILDPFAGSGSTALACINTNRQYIVIEKDENYYQIIEHRVKGFNKSLVPTLFD